MVDQSLLRQAADRGVTICFADLDGADGLWVPEERTVLVNRGLSDAKVAEVIEHELAHVMIDDQHADLDAGKELLVGPPLAEGRRREAVALAAALSLVAVVGGVMYGIHTARGPVKLDRVAPNPNAPGLTVQESGDPKPSLSPSRGPDGRIVYVTVTPPAPTPSTTGSPIMLPTPTATATKPVPAATAARTTAGAPPAPQQTTSPAPPPPPQTTDPPAVTPTPDPGTVAPTTPAVASPGAGAPTGDQGGAGGTDPVGTDPATIAGVSIAPPAGAVAPPDGAGAP